MATEIVLHDGLATLGFPAKAIPSYADKLERYCAEIALFNDTCHLVKASSRADILALHVFDSLAGAACIRECLTRTEPHGDACIGDIGSGGGFPGIPLAVVMPDVQFELVERMATRCAFLENCVAALGLKNVRITQRELEHIPPDSFSVTTFRAFHPLRETMIRALSAVTQPAGWIVAYKARRTAIEDEMAAIATVVPHYTVVPLSVPFLPDRERHLVLIEKC